MGLAISIRDYLKNIDSAYEIITHPRSVRSTYIAQKAHISGRCLAKAVLLTSDSGYLVAVVPSNRKVDLSRVSHMTHQRLGLASEKEINEIIIRNHKREDVTVSVIERLQGNWKVKSSSHKYLQKDAQHIEFSVQIKADKEVNITYSYESSY